MMYVVITQDARDVRFELGCHLLVAVLLFIEFLCVCVE